MESDPNPPKVLLLDDVLPWRMLLEDWLNRNGIETLATGSEAEAFKLLQRPDVKMLVQDFTREPGTRGGFHFMQELREREQKRDFPVVLITGTSADSVRRVFSAHRLSMDEELFAFLTKPESHGEIEELAGAIREHFGLEGVRRG